MKCPKCQAENPDAQKFCGECGRALTEPKKDPAFDYDQPRSYTPKHLVHKILTTRSSIEGERRLMTVFLADVANFTSTSEELDPEEGHQIMDSAFEILMDEIYKYGGTTNQFTGNGMIVLFDAPVAHEDHAQSACYGTLSVQKALNQYREQLRDAHGIDSRCGFALSQAR